ncbi:MAG: hypothetical protein HYX32_14715 [Actinobacteria bacterium]|nr:hypothetical protein [Actinomycetota bacterium]
MAIVLVLVVLVAIGGGVAFFLKSKAGGARDESFLQSDRPAPAPKTATPAEETSLPRLTTPEPKLDDLLSAASASPAAPIEEAAAPKPEPPAEVRLAETAEAADVPDSGGFDRFGSPGARIKKPVSNEPMAPAERVYDMELADESEEAASAPTGFVPPAPEPAPDIERESEPVAVIEPSDGASDTFEFSSLVDHADDAGDTTATDEPDAAVAAAVPEPEPQSEPQAEPAIETGPVIESEPEPVAGAAPMPAPESATAPPEPALAVSGNGSMAEPAAPAVVAPVAPRDAVDHVLQALIGRAQERKVALAQVAAELVEQANLEDREIDEVLGDLIAVAPEERENVDPNERLEELTMFNDAVPKRPGQINAFDSLGSAEKKRVIIRVLCLLVALQEDYKLQPAEPASEAETRSWPLARAVWPVKAQSEQDDDEHKPIQRRKSPKSKLAKSPR